MKVLILSSNNGSGHNSAGKAIMERLDERGIPSEMRDAISFRSIQMSDIIRKVHVNGALYAPWLFKVGNKAASHHVKRGRSTCYYVNTALSKAISRYIRENNFDTVICTHLFPALAMSFARRRHYTNAKLYFVATDYDCAPYVYETCMDGYFIPHAQLMAKFLEAGLRGELLHPTGIPVAEKFSGRMDKTEARKLLGLPEKGTILLFMGGSMGFGKVKSLVAKILKAGPEDTTAVVLVGNNQELYDELIEKYHMDRVLPVQYTNQVDVYMDAADLLLTKPGGLSSTEAAAKGIAMVHTDPIPGWETDNANFFERLGMSRTGKCGRDYIEDALELLASAGMREQMVENQRKNVNANAADDICKIIIQERDQN